MRPVVAFIFLYLNIISSVAKAHYSIQGPLSAPEKSNITNGRNKAKALKDSTIHVFPDEKIKSGKAGKNKGELFFQNSENKNINNKWIRELHNIIVISPTDPSKIDSISTEKSVGNFVKFKGLIINEIKIVKLDVFGRSIDDESEPSKNNLVNRTANSLHIKTRDRVLQRYLMFKKGDHIDPSVLSDTERIIRELPFIEDARIEIEPLPDNDIYVNIILITKDVWSKAFFVELKDINYVKLELYDKNIFGTGMEFQNNFHWNPKKSNNLGYEAIYKNNNTFGTFINSRFYYTNIFEKESYGFHAERSFFTPGIKYAGGSSAYYLNTIKNVWFPDSGYFKEKIKLNYSDFWLGRSFQIKPIVREKADRLNLMIFSGIYREKYSDRPAVTPDTYYLYQNKLLWLSSVAFSRQNFYKSSLIYGFGRTEDIPTGFLANFVIGPEFGEFKTRFYTLMELSGGEYYDYLGYINFKFSLGGFHVNHNFEQGIADLGLSWFTNLLIAGNYKFRFFSLVNYRSGYNRFYDERIFLNNEPGIRGFKGKDIYGIRKLVFKFETLVFTPPTILGFKFATSVFSDLAFIADEKKAIFSDRFYSGIGISVRFRNERLAFPTFHLRFSYYPNFPGLKITDMIKFLGEPRLYHEKFYPDAPAVLKF